MDGIVPAVTRLAVHEEGGHRVYFKNGTMLTDVRDRTSTTTLLQWFETNSFDPNVRMLTNLEFVTKYSWDLTKKAWNRRKQNQTHPTIARMYLTHPGMKAVLCFELNFPPYTVAAGLLISFWLLLLQLLQLLLLIPLLQLLLLSLLYCFSSFTLLLLLLLLLLLAFVPSIPCCRCCCCCCC